MAADYKVLSIDSLKKLLTKMPRTAEIDLEFASRIVNNDEEAVGYFVGSFSRPILNYIVKNILMLRHDANAYQEVYGEYYDFIASPFDQDNEFKPGWSKIAAYRADGNAKLYSYVNWIVSNYFRNQRKKNNKRNVGIEFVDYITLLTADIPEDSQDYTESEKAGQLVKKAYMQLSDVDKCVLDCLCLNKMHWSEAFAKLRCFMNPDGPEGKWKDWSFEEKQAGMDREWGAQQKQFAIAGPKKRAIRHLAMKYNNITELEYE